MQFQAGYILESVKEHLNGFAKQNGKEAEINGLLRYLCTFDVNSTVKLDFSTEAPSIFAVASNILTRGLPTFSSVNIEQHFAKKIGLTHRIDDIGNGKINFPFVLEENDVNTGTDFYRALHVIEPRARTREKYINSSDLESNFERDFILKYIPEQFSYLTQLLEKQRSRNSLTRDNNQGRIDFSLEIPYDIIRADKNRYNSDVQIKHHKTYIVEVDGAMYHTQLIDDLKDFEIAQLSRNISHIREGTAHRNVDEFLKDILSEDCIKIVAENFYDSNYLTNRKTALVLSPIGIARLQKAFIHYLFANYVSVKDKKTLSVAVLERDIPCAHAAFNDLYDFLITLNNLSKAQIDFPQVELEVFVTDAFWEHPLNSGNKISRISEFVQDKYDLIIDISMLRRSGVFKEKEYKGTAVIKIRNCHYTHYKTSNQVYSGSPVYYKPVVVPKQNELFETIDETTAFLRKFLQDIFRKIDFRQGQLPILNRAIQLKSVIGLLPTGGGKSLTYQLAALLQPGITVVIDPIRSLMTDQYRGLKENGIDKCEFINSTLTAAERKFNQHTLLSEGQLQFVFVSPERFVIDDFRIALENATQNGHFFSYVVIDEVHCVSEWGHDFRTPYLNLGENAQKFCHTIDKRNVPLFGLTATASFDVLADIERELHIAEDDGEAIVRFENSVRDEINYLIKEVPVSFEGLDNLSERAIRKLIGQKKQDVVYEIIAEKDKIIRRFNNSSAINSILEHSFINYLPTALRSKYTRNEGNSSEAVMRFTNECFDRLKLGDNPFLYDIKYGKRNFKYGLIVFMPHREGWIGIRNGYNSVGVYDNAEYVTSENVDSLERHLFDDEILGYFMGSGDDEAAEWIDKESFQHLDAFKKNEESIMVATKAFGMGIDKPNIRMTIHANMPQSIESFVQEAGRAGRDGKISTSIILYNNDILKIYSRPVEYHDDRDILMYFHKNSFKGQLKERVMIYELRNMITFPNTRNLHLLNDQMNDLFGNDEVQFMVKLGQRDHSNRIFINTNSGVSIGYINLNDQRTGIYHDFGNDNLCTQLVTWLRSNLPFNQYHSLDQIVTWLDQVVVNHQEQIGIEKLLSGMEVGESKVLPIPFSNKYFSKKTRSQRFFLLNPEHLQKVLKTNPARYLFNTLRYPQDIFENILKDAVFNSHDYPQFIESLQIKDTSFRQKLLNLSDPYSVEFQRAYFLPRSQGDTAKAIYRLVSVGIIDTYTIDYQNKLYYITFIKKDEKTYFKLLEELIARYTSKRVAENLISDLEKRSRDEIVAGKATAISKILEFLTEFIYDRIARKRLQAIDDMVNLCKISILHKDPLKQNHEVKDQIYYYFNAKYSKPDYKETTSDGYVEASMPDDLKNDMPVYETINKYIKLVELQDTGEFISNIKHLRGSTMRMLRSNPDKPQFRILKAFSLFILADAIKELIQEAKEEMVNGLMDWKVNEDPDINVVQFLIDYRIKLMKHVLRYNVPKVFEDIEDRFFITYYASWTKKFNEKFLIKS